MEVVFYDLETTIPATDIIEFGGIVLDKTGLYERESYSTLIKSDKITQKSIDCNGITLEMVKDSPSFADVADNIFNILDGRIWAGHNIVNFDNRCINDAFKKLGRPAPKPKGIIDTLPLLRSTFGARAGNMKMATLGNYFGLGQERHRAIEDSRMTLEVLKNCAVIMFLEEHVGYAGKDSVIDFKEDVSKITSPIIEQLRKAIADKQEIWISYDGGSHPLVPRKIKPLKWEHEPWLLEAFCYQGQCKKMFTQRKIREIRDEEWTIERKESSSMIEEIADILRKDPKKAAGMYRDAYQKADDWKQLSLVADGVANRLADKNWGRKLLEETLAKADTALEYCITAELISHPDGLNDKAWAKEVFETALRKAETEEDKNDIKDSMDECL